MLRIRSSSLGVVRSRLSCLSHGLIGGGRLARSKMKDTGRSGRQPSCVESCLTRIHLFEADGSPGEAVWRLAMWQKDCPVP